MDKREGEVAYFRKLAKREKLKREKEDEGKEVPEVRETDGSNRH